MTESKRHSWITIPYRRVVLGICTSALFVTVFGRLAISPLVPAITDEFAVTNTLVGIALTAMWVSYALTQYPSGVLSDRFGDRLIILISIGGTGATSLILATAPNFRLFAVGTVLLGGVAGLHYSVATALLGRIFDDVGTAIGIHNGGAPLAGILAPILVTAVATAYDWRVALTLSAVVALPVFVGGAKWIQHEEPRRLDDRLLDQFDFTRIGALWKRPSVLFTGIIAIILDFTWQAIASFLPAFFIQFHGLPQEQAAVLFGVYFVALGVLQVGIGYLADWVGYDSTTAVCMLSAMLGIGILINGSSFRLFVLGVSLIGLGMGFGGAVFPRFMDQVPARSQSVDFGIFRTCYMIVAALGPAVVGYLSDGYNWNIAFEFLMVVLGVGCLLLAANYLTGNQL